MDELLKKDNVHKVLAHSYMTFFLLFLTGIVLDSVAHYDIFSHIAWGRAGWILAVLGTLLILWAQTTSRNMNKTDLKKETFMHGPYLYSRSPTHWGLLLLMLGFGIITNALFVILTALVAFLISRFYFLKKEEDLLEKKYGAPYSQYRHTIWL